MSDSLQGEPTSRIGYTLKRRRLQLSLLEFGKEAFQRVQKMPFVDGRYIKTLATYLQAFGQKEINRLLMNLPPSTGKSTWVSVLLPAWVWASNPAAQFAYYSYVDKLAERDSRLCNELVKSDWYQHYFPDVQIKFGDDSVKSFSTTAGGNRFIGVPGGGFSTGGHPDYVVLEDPLSVDQSERRSARERLGKFFFETLPSRGVAKGSHILVDHQRTHVEDLAGKILDRMDSDKEEYGSTEWLHVCLPMRYSKEHAMEAHPEYGGDWREEEGQLLFPELLDEEKVVRLERELGPYGKAAQLDQRPRWRKGELFDVDKLIRVTAKHPLPPLNEFEQFVRAWDRAATEGGGCYTSGVLIGRIGQSFYILHVVRKQLGWAKVESLIEKWVHLDEQRYGVDRLRTYIEREGAASGKQIAEMTEERYRGHRVHAVSPRGSKAYRAEQLADAIETSRFHVLVGPWFSEFVEELSKYSPEKDTGYKDQADAASMAYIEMVSPSNKKHKHRGLVLAKAAPDVPAMGSLEPCKHPECKRPAFEAPFCCSGCKASYEAGRSPQHGVKCNEKYNDWKVRA